MLCPYMVSCVKQQIGLYGFLLTLVHKGQIGGLTVVLWTGSRIGLLGLLSGVLVSFN